MNRTLNVVRLQFVNKQTFLWIPLIVLVGAFVIALLVFSLIPADGPMYSGAAQAPLWYFAIIGSQALTLTFPFAQAMSLTRREFYLGSLAAAAISAAAMATVFTIGAALESATDGFGTNGYTFQLPFLTEEGWWVAWLAYFVIAMFFFVVGFWGATIYVRFRGVVFAAVLVGITLLAVVGAWLISRMDAWPRVWQWLADQGALGLTGWAALLLVLLAGSSFLTLRRATP
ncbi:hypothetical protein [Actinotalea caeni]|uniref:hypothetical protein n=1 Tax=Actinotalea caeni TaxID=1348467 RepID=UPI0012E1BA85|nr:hypothetical protein [Actinotalea caeni]